MPYTRIHFNRQCRNLQVFAIHPQAVYTQYNVRCPLHTLGDFNPSCEYYPLTDIIHLLGKIKGTSDPSYLPQLYAPNPRLLPLPTLPLTRIFFLRFSASCLSCSKSAMVARYQGRVYRFGSFKMDDSQPGRRSRTQDTSLRRFPHTEQATIKGGLLSKENGKLWRRIPAKLVVFSAKIATSSNGPCLAHKHLGMHQDSLFGSFCSGRPDKIIRARRGAFNHVHNMWFRWCEYTGACVKTWWRSF